MNQFLLDVSGPTSSRPHKQTRAPNFGSFLVSGCFGYSLAISGKSMLLECLKYYGLPEAKSELASENRPFSKKK